MKGGGLRLDSLADVAGLTASLPVEMMHARDPLRSPPGALALAVEPPPPRMNGTEQGWAGVLELRKRAGNVLRYEFEGMTLRLADDTRFTPDFVVLLANREIELHETKGFMRDDAWVKLKVAAAFWSCFRFVLVRKVPKKDGGGWSEKVIA